MGDQDIDVLGQGIPDFVGAGLMVLKAPIVEQWLIGRSKYFETLYCDLFMMEVGTDILEFLYFHL